MSRDHPFRTPAGIHCDQQDRILVVQRLEARGDCAGLRVILDTAEALRTQKAVLQKAGAALRRIEKKGGNQ